MATANSDIMWIGDLIRVGNWDNVMLVIGDANGPNLVAVAMTVKGVTTTMEIDPEIARVLASTLSQAADRADMFAKKNES